MKIVPNDIRKKALFWNGIALVLAFFCIAYFATAVFFDVVPIKLSFHPALQNGVVFGPIKVEDKPIVYNITAKFNGHQASTSLTGSVLDEDKEEIYEFTKDLWHESGWDSEGPWTESDNIMRADLTFKEKGTYYLKFQTEKDYSNYYFLNEPKTETYYLDNVTITMKQLRGSYIPYLITGCISFLAALFLFFIFNFKWIWDFSGEIGEKLSEAD